MTLVKVPFFKTQIFTAIVQMYFQSLHIKLEQLEITGLKQLRDFEAIT